MHGELANLLTSLGHHLLILAQIAASAAATGATAMDVTQGSLPPGIIG